MLTAARRIGPAGFKPLKERVPMRKVLLVAGAAALASVPALAQEKGTVELGGFGRFTSYDETFDVARKRQNSYGGGGRLGYFFSPRFSLELDGSFNATDLESYFAGQLSSPIRYWPFHLRGLYHAPLGSGFNLLLGGGPVLNHYGKSSNTSVKTINGQDFGVGGLVALRYRVTESWSIRADGTIDFMPSPRNGSQDILDLGPTNPDEVSKNIHLGAQLGLGLYPNARCTKRLDAIDLLPNSATVTTGQSVQFNVTGRLCDGSSTTPQVTYAVTPSGTIGASGVFSSTTPGSFRVIARTLNGRLADTSTVTVNAPPPPPPPPPPPTLSRIAIAPRTSALKPGESVTYAITGTWSDGNTRAMRADECSLSADGSPTASGWTYSWSRSGDYTVTATCLGQSDRASAAVRGLTAVLRAMFGPNQYSAASRIDRMSLDSVAGVMQADPTLRVYIDGHTDWRNSTRYNGWLGERRAEFIQRQLVRRGIARERLFARSFGECRPAADNSTEEGMAQNRRVELNQVETPTPEPGNATCQDLGPPGASRIGRRGE
jgi:hypothetical protein